MNETQQLLARYVADGSEAAFAALVSRYLNLVYSTALRLTDGDTHQAKDVTQIVFVQLARNAHKLSDNSALGGWLHRTTCNTASNLLRAERRRQKREMEAMHMNAQTTASSHGSEEVAPVLDQAINELAEADRTAIVLRFFEQQDFRSVGLALGSNEDAARMRVNRALEKLQGMLKKKGVAFSSTALATMLTASTVNAAPAGLSGSITTIALATTGSAGSTLGLLHIMSQTKVIMAGAVLVTGLAGTLVWQHRSVEQLGNENASLRKEAIALQDELDSLKRRSQPKAVTSTLTDQERTELLRLRGEMGTMRRQLAESGRRQDELRKSNQAYARELGISKTEEKEKEQAMQIMTNAKRWMLAFRIYAEENNHLLPSSFEQVTDILEKEADWNDFRQTAGHFEIFPMRRLPDGQSENIVMLRGVAVPSASGVWHRAYAFVDGHVETHSSPNGDFTAVEAQRGIIYPPALKEGK